MAIRRVSSPHVQEPPPNTFSSCLAVGDQIFLAGVTAMGPDGKAVGGNDMGAQTRAVLTSIKHLVEAAGGAMADIVKVVVYVTDISRRPEINKVRPEFFSGNFPCSTLVEVKALVTPELLIEIDATAIIGASKS